ncbi:MAG: hypothetical protein GY927_24820 [bacterium]|nr:hypothetical protein [bacterium]
MGLLSQFSSKAELHRRETVKRFDDFILSYVSKVEKQATASKEDLSVTLIARSPESAVTDAVRRHANTFVDLGIEVRVIFASIEPASVFADFVEMAGMYNGQNCLDTSLRWAKNPALLDAHEQLVLGMDHCWSGDAMRRAADVRFSLDLFESAGANAVELGRAAFIGLWSASANIPKSRFRNVTPARANQPVVIEIEGIRDQLLENAFEGCYATRH